MNIVIPRAASVKILDFLNNSAIREVLIVEGARQVGKTTAIEQALVGRRAIKLNLEGDTRFRERIDAAESFEDFEFYLRDKFKFNPADKEQILFLDEAQESDKLGAYVRFIKERWDGAKVILSGSSMSRLFRDEQRIPVGRYRTLLISPLSFKEFVLASGRDRLLEIIQIFERDLNPEQITAGMHNDLLALFDQYLKVGGLPAVVTAYFQGQSYRDLRGDIIRSQEEDFIRKSSIGDRDLFKSGLKGVANYLGFSSKNTHVHEKQHIAEKVLSIERAWRLIYEIEQKGINATSRFFPKRYLYDIGVAQEIREMPFPEIGLLSSDSPILRTQIGGVFENAVLSQMISHQNSEANISGWKKNSNEGIEVDFIWRLEDALLPIECKASLRVTSRSFASLRQYTKLTGASVAILVSAAPYSAHKEGAVTFINMPVYLFSGGLVAKIWAQYAC
jgi:predicted AAA+ superfamily ATPase